MSDEGEKSLSFQLEEQFEVFKRNSRKDFKNWKQGCYPNKKYIKK